ncbi:MAG TPA: TIGR03617 family F420-dependent LLM class oxidoreductase, partial [Candidatus Tectomicrobia bacterium]|nr:TIGR03617 family F420-dependent LLM class oxidoreductase [Candidatus Tectomicrobia bacterium]
MELNVSLREGDLREVGGVARALEAQGIEGLWSAETQHDPFLPLAVAAVATERLRLGTALAIAFARSPMVLAHVAWDLQRASRGRFALGLGTQVKAHNERRFSVPWSAPAPRLREVVLALRAIWRAWQRREPLAFRGQHYRFDLMTPFFDPGPIDHPDIPIHLGAVNPAMCRLAGEVADGVLVHSFHSARYLAEVVRPAVAEGARAAGRRPEAIALHARVFAIVGDAEAERAEMREAVRRQIAFYASTRTYAPVLAVHGW